MTDENGMIGETLSTEDEGFDLSLPEGPESVEDSARAVLAEMGELAAADEAEPEPEAKPTIEPSEAARILAQSKKPKPGKGERVTAKAQKRELSVAPKEGELPAASEKVEPPARMGVKDREWFMQQPPEAQRALKSAFDNLDGHYTKQFQVLQRQKARHTEIESVLEQYRPAWHQQGMSEAQAIRELASTGAAMRTDPVGTIQRLMQVTGVTVDHLAGYQPAAHRQAQPAHQPQQQFLTRDDLTRIMAEENQRSQMSSQVQASTQDMERLRNELDPTGTRYFYPELWDTNQPGQWNAGYLARVQPLVEDVRKTQPGLSYGEAVRRAIHTLRLLNGEQTNTNGSLSPANPRLPNREQELAAARHASSSVRSRGNGLIPAVTQATGKESYEESARAVLAQFQNSQH